MPSNLLAADTSFPDLKTPGKSTDQKFGEVSNYLYMLLEQLRYTLGNLGIENFNDAEIEELANIITEPVYIQLSDIEGNVSSLYVEVDNVTSRISDAEGNISTLQQTSNSLISSVSNLEGDVSTLQQTASSLTSRISDAEGNISNITQTVSSISTQLSTAEGNISSLTQTVNSISLSVVNGTSGSMIQLNRNGVVVSSQYIQFTGMVTFSDLSTQGQTTINGGNIAAGGTISGVTLQSMSNTDSGFEVCYGTKYSYQLVGGIKYDANGSGTETEAKYRMFIYTQPGWAMKLESGSSASFTADGTLYLRGETNATLSGGSGSIYLTGSSVYINGTDLETFIRNVVG